MIISGASPFYETILFTEESIKEIKENNLKFVDLDNSYLEVLYNEITYKIKIFNSSRIVLVKKGNANSTISFGIETNIYKRFKNDFFEIK